jgi:1-acyl-sn-glycerol-3-phosphate acyltransferase
MNGGAAKRFWTACQRAIGAPLIELATSRLLRVHGLEHVLEVPRDRPLLLVANHRSFFDMYVVSSVLFRRGVAPRALLFPVRGRYFYQSLGGVFVNLFPGFWSMYPPFFATPGKQDFDRYALGILTAFAREGEGHVVGFHPEGTRNKGDDPYSFLPAQPGVGRLIKEARPRVIPVFIAGLGNRIGRQIIANFRGGEPIRVWFGPPLDFADLVALPDRARTYKAIADACMAEVKELADMDRVAMRSGSAA